MWLIQGYVSLALFSHLLFAVCCPFIPFPNAYIPLWLFSDGLSLGLFILLYLFFFDSLALLAAATRPTPTRFCPDSRQSAAVSRYDRTLRLGGVATLETFRTSCSRVFLHDNNKTISH